MIMGVREVVWNQCMLNLVNKFQNVVLVTNWKITLIFFWFPYKGAVFGQSEETTGGVGTNRGSFYLFNY